MAASGSSGRHELTRDDVPHASLLEKARAIARVRPAVLLESPMRFRTLHSAAAAFGGPLRGDGHAGSVAGGAGEGVGIGAGGMGTNGGGGRGGGDDVMPTIPIKQVGKEGDMCILRPRGARDPYAHGVVGVKAAEAAVNHAVVRFKLRKVPRHTKVHAALQAAGTHQQGTPLEAGTHQQGTPLEAGSHHQGTPLEAGTHQQGTPVEARDLPVPQGKQVVGVSLQAYVQDVFDFYHPVDFQYLPSHPPRPVTAAYMSDVLNGRCQTALASEGANELLVMPQPSFLPTHTAIDPTVALKRFYKGIDREAAALVAATRQALPAPFSKASHAPPRRLTAATGLQSANGAAIASPAASAHDVHANPAWTSPRRVRGAAAAGGAPTSGTLSGGRRGAKRKRDRGSSADMAPAKTTQFSVMRARFDILSQLATTAVPKQPLDVPVHELADGESHLRRLRALFARQPCWNIQELCDEMKLTKTAFAVLLPAVAYTTPRGPWRNSWWELGYDPRVHADMRFMQVIDCRLPASAGRQFDETCRLADALKSTFTTHARPVKRRRRTTSSSADARPGQLGSATARQRSGTVGGPGVLETPVFAGQTIAKSRLFRVSALRHSLPSTDISALPASATFSVQAGWLPAALVSEIRANVVSAMSGIVATWAKDVAAAAAAARASPVAPTPSPTPAPTPASAPASAPTRASAPASAPTPASAPVPEPAAEPAPTTAAPPTETPASAADAAAAAAAAAAMRTASAFAVAFGDSGDSSDSD